MLWRCWLGGRKGIRPVKNMSCGNADLHMTQLMPLLLIVSCFSKIHIAFAFLVPDHTGSPRKRVAVKRVCARWPRSKYNKYGRPVQCRVTVAELMNKSDHDLFCKLCAPTHALNHLLPPARNCASLRTRGHSYQLPEYSTDLRKKSFLIRSLYSFVKWNSFFLVLLLCTGRHSDFAFYVYYLMCICCI